MLTVGDGNRVNPWLSRTVTLRYHPETRARERPDYPQVAVSSVLGTLLEEPRTAGSNAGLYAGLGVAAVAALAAATVTPPKANSQRKE